ncbi:N-acyl-phosphatidylethanolamine-hydrolyzing phospholipase D [Fistulina hepatica ATCC 64428]|uniref:N-acyl-phosphatidylethanolamine-hydrolyzing phospholipase D n=1 Tax=Fistulina hepatica ATCC 64428 TaxID=1128425 RepID=A0A0D7ACZ0_9AGAR|nr:N-acyl-phosphatidylethanolamine-hydrolyzing phospholipase D [Fistulina hepatica ATCC 64428]
MSLTNTITTLGGSGSTATVSRIFTARQVGSPKPAHWVDDEGTSFQNPWPSWYTWSTMEKLQLLFEFASSMPKVPKDIDSKMVVHKPQFKPDHERLRVNWLGHACFLLELPARSSIGKTALDRPERGIRILFDPVFSERCSPFSFWGPKRYTPPPCRVEELPEIDAVVISHNHYDHLDAPTLRALFERGHKPHVFAPLGNEKLITSFGLPASHCHTADWWDTYRMRVSIPASSNKAQDKPDDAVHKLCVDFTATPCQHQTARGPFDMFKTLWSSWAIREVFPDDISGADGSATTGKTVFFTGDTGYRNVGPGQKEDEVPTCPAFREAGEKFGGFDLALIPIGAYEPRRFMSTVHCAPQDSVMLFKDLRAKKALGMHWGTWMLTCEDVLDPPERLKAECAKVGVEEGRFVPCELGENLYY